MKDYMEYVLQQTVNVVSLETLKSSEGKKYTTSYHDISFVQVILKFESGKKANKAVHKLNQEKKEGNDSILHACVKKSKEHGTRELQDEDELKLALLQIRETTRKLLEAHDGKIQQTVEELNNSKVQRHIRLEDYERITAERSAVEDKKLELENQQKEFQSFLKLYIIQELTAIKPGEHKFKKKLLDIRTSFGRECNKLRAALPMYARRKDILNTVNEHQVCVVLGETGSGKSTQMVQYLQQDGFGKKGMIACTQPRKVAAVSLAKHVASEMGCQVGEVVGYHIGMQARKGKTTEILYMTDHILLNECLKDPTLAKYSCIIMDEAHERSIFTDLLIGMIKRCLPQRRDLKVIITSATINPDVFVNYFAKCPVLKVSGRMFPVEVEWQTPKSDANHDSDYVMEAVDKVLDVHNLQAPGDVLVFLTSPPETERACDMIMKRRNGAHGQDLVVMQLHGRLQAEDQQKVFKQVPQGTRKVVFATNSAETSITIPGIKYVIDTGFVKEVQYDPKRNMSSLNVTRINKSSAEQRKGRAGRTAAGKCYRLYTEEEYQDMEPMSKPEIFRVHLGQALLKLMDLGITDPLEFQFVESPSGDALQTAMKSVFDLGAVDTEGITDLGMKMAKLPLDPNLSSLVLKGINAGVGFEALILASMATVPGNVFFRMGTEDEKRNADKYKARFCHSKGDHMTLLNVYQEWLDVPERQRNQWCGINYINAKAMRSAREAMNDLYKTIQKEIGLKINYGIFQPKEMVESVLPKIIFSCYSNNLCLYLGHDRAGYQVARLNKSVHVHPSSALKSLSVSPKWLVFDQLLRTSRDYIINLTLVEDDWVREFHAEEKIAYDLESLEKKTMVLDRYDNLGNQLMWKLIGPRYTSLKKLENTISLLCNEDIVVLEPSRKRGDIQIYTHPNNHSISQRTITEYLHQYKEELKEETVELPLSSTSSAVRAIIGYGGLVQYVMMPNKFRRVLVTHIPDSCDDEDAKQHCSKFGEVVDIQKFHHRGNHKARFTWGKITFQNPSEAEMAVSSNKENGIQLKPDMPGSNSNLQQEFRVKIKWCRRPSKGYGFVRFATPEDTIMALPSLRGAYIGGASFSTSKHNPVELHVAKLPKDVDEGELQNEIERVLPRGINVEKITIIREKVEAPTECRINAYKHQLITQIGECGVAKANLKLEMFTPKPDDFFYKGVAVFSNPTDGQRAVNNLQRRIIIADQLVDMEPELCASIRIQPPVFDAIRQNVLGAIERLDRGKQGNLRIQPPKPLKNGWIVIDIKGDTIADVAETKSALDDIIKGDTIECTTAELKRNLLSVSAREVLQKISKKTDAYIWADNRVSCVKVWGTEEAKTRAKIEINEYLDLLCNEKCERIPLSGSGKPAGLMKALLRQFGINLEEMQAQSQATRLDLDLRKHILNFQGSEQAYATVISCIQHCMESLPQPTESGEDPVECVICFSPTEDEHHRLEYCGHPCCSECIQNQLRVAIESKQFPINCAKEDCDEAMSWKDINTLCNTEKTKRMFLEAAVSAFVSKNKANYFYCIKSDCSIVYERSNDGKIFRCCECATEICTTCHVQSHVGLTCAMYQSMKKCKDYDLIKWMSKDPENRKLCPKCKATIEKIGGCQRMICTVCQINICWKCCDTFPTEQKCYAHLQKVHGSFM